VHNQIVPGEGGHSIHKGIPPKLVADATHTEIRPVQIRDQERGSGFGHAPRQDPGGRTLPVYRPNLPQPGPVSGATLVGVGVKPASPGSSHSRGNPTFDRGVLRQPQGAEVAIRPEVPVAAAANRSVSSGSVRNPAPSTTPAGSLIISSPKTAEGMPARHDGQPPAIPAGTRSAPVAGNANSGQPSSSSGTVLHNSPVQHRSPWPGPTAGLPGSPKANEQRSAGYVAPAVPQRAMPVYQQPQYPAYRPSPMPAYQQPQIPAYRQSPTAVYQQPQATVVAPRPSFQQAPSGYVQPLPQINNNMGSMQPPTQNSWQGGSLQRGH